MSNNNIERRWWYSIYRMAIGAVFLAAGGSKLWGFAHGDFGLVAWLIDLFKQETFIPVFLVQLIGYTMPLAEFFIGVTLFLGLFRKAGTIVALTTFGTFLFGSELVHYQEGMLLDIIQQMCFMFSFVFLAMMMPKGDDPLSLDERLRKT